jgi:hypothetical protein
MEHGTVGGFGKKWLICLDIRVTVCPAQLKLAWEKENI